MQRLASLGLGMGAAGGLAINCDNIGVTVTQAADPGDEALGEQPGIQGVHQVVQRIVAGDAVFVRQEPAQEGDEDFAPVIDFNEVVGSDNGGAEDQQHDLRKWVDHFDTLSWVLQRGKVMQQGRGLGRVVHGGLRIGTGHPRITFRSLCESPLLRQPSTRWAKRVFQAIALPGLPPRIGFGRIGLYHPPSPAMPPAPEATPMPDTPPDRLSNNPKSPYHDAALLERGGGIRFKGVEKTNVEEYCVSEGWVRVAVGKTVDRHGVALTMKLSGQ